MPPTDADRSIKALGYCRVSTDDQANSGLSLRGQKSTIESEARVRGWDLLDVLMDTGLSGKKLDKRIALAECLRRLKSGEASVLVVPKLDRLARSVADFALLVRQAEKEGWAILVADLQMDMTTPTGGLVANITASVAEWEGRIISERTKDALRIKKAEGFKLGRPRTVDPSVAQRIKTERRAGKTLQTIADGLNADRIPTPMGKTWSHASVRKISLQ